jgi:glutaminase
VRELPQAAYDRHRHVADGVVATYIPQLADADPAACAASVASVTGSAFEVGDADVRFSIQSVSKPFVLALVVEALGADRARNLLGANATGLPFDSVMAVEVHDHRTMNPMVNAGAIAATSLAPEVADLRGGDAGAGSAWDVVLASLSAFAGRRLAVDDDVYACESGTNLRNRGIAHLLHSYGRVHCDPDVATDLYTRQCSVSVDVHDLAVMAATLADGGVNPMTGERVVSDRVRPRARRDGDGRPLRAGGRLALGGRAAGQERGERCGRDGGAGQGRAGRVVTAARRRRQQRARAADHPLPEPRPGAQRLRLGGPPARRSARCLTRA